MAAIIKPYGSGFDVFSDKVYSLSIHFPATNVEKTAEIVCFAQTFVAFVEECVQESENRLYDSAETEAILNAVIKEIHRKIADKRSRE